MSVWGVSVVIRDVFVFTVAKETGMSQVIDGAGYKCRSKVLASFFKQSRDRWKQRCHETKRVLKRVTNRAVWLETSRDEWKARAKQLEEEVRRLRAEQKAVPL